MIVVSVVQAFRLYLETCPSRLTFKVQVWQFESKVSKQVALSTTVKE